MVLQVKTGSYQILASKCVKLVREPIENADTRDENARSATSVGNGKSNAITRLNALQPYNAGDAKPSPA